MWTNGKIPIKTLQSQVLTQIQHDTTYFVSNTKPWGFHWYDGDFMLPGTVPQNPWSLQSGLITIWNSASKIGDILYWQVTWENYIYIGFVLGKRKGKLVIGQVWAMHSGYLCFGRDRVWWHQLCRPLIGICNDLKTGNSNIQQQSKISLYCITSVNFLFFPSL